MMRNIGEVSFAKEGTNYPECIMGKERVRLLKLARDGQPLPDGLHLVGQRCGSGYEPITRDQVRWDGLGDG